MKKTILLILFVIALLFFSYKISIQSFLEAERLECANWEREQHEYFNWYSVEWQKEQCQKFGIVFVK